MTPASLGVLLVASFVMALIAWAVQLRRPRGAIVGVAFVYQALVGLYFAYLGVTLFRSSGPMPQESGLIDSMGVWLGVGDLAVGSPLELHASQLLGCVLVYVGTCASLWRSRNSHARLSPLLGLQVSLWLCLLATSLPFSLSGFILAGYFLQQAQLGTVTLPMPVGVNGVHRTADAFAMSAVLMWLMWSPSVLTTSVLQLQTAGDDSVLVPVAGFVASSWLVLMLSLSLAARSLAASSLRPFNRSSVISGLLVVSVSAYWACSIVPGRLRLFVISGALLGLVLPSLLRSHFVSTRVSPLFHRTLRWTGLVVSGTARWGFAGFLLQAPVVAIDACARLLKLFAGGDIQRYVAIGVIGLAGFMYVATRPAAPGSLDIQTDGLRVRADARRGSLSSARLIYDYDFDGDQQIDRAAAGPVAGFSYSAAGTYSVSVIIRDPFWHTQRTLSAKVMVKP
jgi:hypothetical protein